MIEKSQLEGPQKVTWCKGCGNFGILAALKKMAIQLEVPHEELVLVSGIGCSGKLPHYINLNSFHTLHGRPIPIATGVHATNGDLKVIVITGDGDCLGEGLGHYLHAARRNVNLAVFIHNNGVNGLTKGQFSPASPRGYVSKTSPPPTGAPMDPVEPLALAIANGATYAARGFSGDLPMLVELMVQAVQHEGFAVIDIFQPCVTWNRQLTWKYYNEHTYSLQQEEHDVTDKMAAISKALEDGEKIPIGLFYKTEKQHLTKGLAIPTDGKLRDKKNDPEKVQKLIDRLVLE
ncbi:MAG: 2-oxoacid ferredoxin oxidoreductase [Candidatus Lokiarchaeota archaeon]|nr:2-oxoacid ferredoxin oxidoreductase [Candidatus Lokiarchaeota archaeon]